MIKPNEKKLDWHVPADILVHLILPAAALMYLVAESLLLPPLLRARAGDPTLLLVALIMSFVGIALLFTARLPLYRERRYFTFGSHSLDERHRRIYRWAYRLLGTGGILLLLLVMTRK